MMSGKYNVMDIEFIEEIEYFFKSFFLKLM